MWENKLDVGKLRQSLNRALQVLVRRSFRDVMFVVRRSFRDVMFVEVEPLLSCFVQKNCKFEP
jgi:hypothetical protein